MTSRNQQQQNQPANSGFRQRSNINFSGKRTFYIPLFSVFLAVTEPYFPLYEPYLKERTDPTLPVWKQGFCMCKYNPCHVVRAHALAQHESFCPDKLIDEIINKKLDRYLGPEK